MAKRWIVALESDCWLAPQRDDACGRTLVRQYAATYGSVGKAERALRLAREYRSFPNAKIEEIQTP